MVLFPVTTLCVLSVVGLGEGSVGVDGEGGCFGCDGDGFCGGVGEHVDDVGGGGVLSVHGFLLSLGCGFSIVVGVWWCQAGEDFLVGVVLVDC